MILWLWVITVRVVYVSPQKKLILVRNGESYGEFNGMQGWLDMFYQFASSIELELRINDENGEENAEISRFETGKARR